MAVVNNSPTVTVWHKGTAGFSVPVPSGQTWVFGNTTALSVGRALPFGDGYNWSGRVWLSNVRVSKSALYTDTFYPNFPSEEQGTTAALIKGRIPASLGVTVQVAGPGSQTPTLTVLDVPALDSYVI